MRLKEMEAERSASTSKNSEIEGCRMENGSFRRKIIFIRVLNVQNNAIGPCRP